ncbi:MAG: hypothetical protein IJW87_06585 [Clostridia bacterium]|nr:hypothetical protein [Clostridia bacterium]
MTNEIYTWANDMYPLVKKRFEERYASRMNLIANIAGIVKQNETNYELPGLGGYGELPVYEGGELSFADGSKSFITTVTPVERALALPVSYKRAKIDMVGEADKTGVRLADSAYMTVLSEFYRVFGGAFTVVGADGKPWASDAHPVDTDKTETFSNLVTDELSIEAICAAQAKAAGFVTADGLPFIANFDLLLVSPELEATARMICGEDALLTPAGGLGGKNGMRYMVCGGGSLGLTGKQWALADSMLLPEVLKLVYITEPTVVVSPRENPLMTDYISYVDFAFGFGDARPIIFANPA